MDKGHFLVYSDRELVDTAIQLILESDPKIRVVSSRVVESKSIEDTTDVYALERGDERAELWIIIGDRELQVGPYDSEYWINIQGLPEGAFPSLFSDFNEPFARDITNILLAHGARQRHKGSERTEE